LLLALLASTVMVLLSSAVMLRFTGEQFIAARWCAGGLKADAVHWTRSDTQFAAIALAGNDGVQQLACPDDGIYRTGRQALRASDAHAFVDDRYTRRQELATTRVE
jgi:hypothetical protein